MNNSYYAISVNNLSKKFGEDTVLHSVCRDFEQGKIHGIVGNNGSGKTVLMKCICGFYTPTSGSVFVNGEQVGKDVDFPDDLGIIIETPGFLPNLTGLKNLQILASLKRNACNYTIREIIKLVGLDPDMKKSVSKYSLGMRQRLGIAQAIMEDPSTLILDEPFNGLDKYSAAEIRGLIKRLREFGKTIILASHNQQDIDELCDTVCEMDAGVMMMVR
jgi:ABC-2 type transport system ATP-binding protein